MTRSELAVEGHGVGAYSLLLPGIALAASLVWMCVTSARDTRAARLLIAQHALGPGPRNSLIVGGSDVLFAVAGLIRPRIVVSAGALTSLDDDELAAGLDHEAGHIVHRHRFVMLLAVGLRALGRVVPGTGRAVREIAFHLERDADRWALHRRNDRIALASVICKAAGTGRPPALAGLGGSDVPERLGQVLDASTGTSRRARTALDALATAAVVCTLLVGAVVPAAAVSGAGADSHGGHHQHHCHHDSQAPPTSTTRWAPGMILDR
jgi:hypothetical protein